MKKSCMTFSASRSQTCLGNQIGTCLYLIIKTGREEDRKQNWGRCFMLYMRVKSVNPEFLSQGKYIFLFFFSFESIWDDEYSLFYSVNHFMIYISQIIVLYTLKYTVLYVNDISIKLEGKQFKENRLIILESEKNFLKGNIEIFMDILTDLNEVWKARRDWYEKECSRV